MNQKEIKKSLKNKTILLASWGCKIQTSQESRDWPPVFKNFFKKEFYSVLKMNNTITEARF